MADRNDSGTLAGLLAQGSNEFVARQWALRGTM